MVTCCEGRCYFVTASILLTAALIASGIAFFSPYWLNNVNNAGDSNTTYITSNGSSIVNIRPYRGLWAQCGSDCTWFWNNNYELQINKFTPLKWHLATQVLYFIGAALILICEIYARVQMCTRERFSIYYSIGAILLLSVMVQTGALAAFGGGACRDPYDAVSNPVIITQSMMNEYQGIPTGNVYIGWSYWMAAVGDMITLISALFFLVAGCYVNDDDDDGHKYRH